MTVICQAAHFTQTLAKSVFRSKVWNYLKAQCGPFPRPVAAPEGKRRCPGLAPPLQAQ